MKSSCVEWMGSIYCTRHRVSVSRKLCRLSDDILCGDPFDF